MKISLLNEFGEFPIPEEHPCRRFVDKGDRQRWNTSISEVPQNADYMKVHQKLTDMYDTLGTYQAITNFSGGRIKASTARGIICCISQKVKPETVEIVNEVYEQFRRRK